MLVNNDIKSVVDLVDFIGEQEEKIQQIEDRQKEIYRESSSRKRSINNEEQYWEYQIWHMEVQEELDELKQEKREIKRQIQLALDVIIKKSQQGVYVSIYVNDIEKQKEALDRLMSYRSRFLQIYEYQKQEDDKMAALHAKLIVSDVKKSLVSSANLSYHGMQGNIEMGFLIESHDKAKQIEEVMKEMVRMKVCGKYK